MNIYARKLENTRQVFRRVEEMLPDFITVGKQQILGRKLTFVQCVYSRYSRKYDQVITHVEIRCVENTPTNMDEEAIYNTACRIYKNIINEIGVRVKPI